ncbi:MAG TPA: hypothetical protein VF610_05340, partial [Segetibacter sp.]
QAEITTTVQECDATKATSIATAGYQNISSAFISNLYIHLTFYIAGAYPLKRLFATLSITPLRISALRKRSKIYLPVPFQKLLISV